MNDLCGLPLVTLFLELLQFGRVELFEYNCESWVIRPTNRLVELVAVPFFEKIGVVLFLALRMVAGDLILILGSLSHLMELMRMICLTSRADLEPSFFFILSSFFFFLPPISLSCQIFCSMLFRGWTFESMFSCPAMAGLRSPSLGRLTLESSLIWPSTCVAISC